MNDHQAKREKGRPTPRELWRLLLAIVAVVAIIQELRKPPEQRTWHGLVAGFVPYDFRKPTMERFRSAYWDPEGSIVSSKALGVGWTLNVGAVAQRLRQTPQDQ
jgi:hypothetical protein